MVTRPRPDPVDPADPRVQGLPWGDGRVRRLAFHAPTTESARLAEGFLASRGWQVRRLGRARSAVGPNRMCWVYAWLIGEKPEDP